MRCSPRNHIRLAVLGVALWPLGVAVSAEPERIDVTAAGKTSIQPDVAEIQATVNGNAPMAADALKKYRDNRRRAVDTLKKLKLENLTIEDGGISLRATNANAQRMAQMFGGNANVTPGQISASETLSIRLTGIDRLKSEEVTNLITKVLDTAKDAGLTTGGQSAGMHTDLVRFRTTKLNEARAAAVKSAMQIAREKADLLAQASKQKIVRVLSSREIPPAASANNSNSAGAANVFVMMAMAEMGMGGGGDSEENTTVVLQPITVSVTIEVQFAAQESP